MISMNLTDIAILNIQSAPYCSIISGIGKKEMPILSKKLEHYKL